MLTKLKTAALSALIGLGAIAALPAAAQAEGLYLNYGSGHHGAGMGAHVGDYHRYDYRHDRRQFSGCTPYRAVDKAERYGVRRARVVDVGRHTITVDGRKWDRRVRMTFGRAPSCPVVHW